MRETFDTITDWIAIPLFALAIVALSCADLVSLRASSVARTLSYRRARHVALVAALAAGVLTVARFAVLAAG